jgi:hypothetical protein
MPDNLWIQYGSFGLLALLVVWALLKGIPALMDKHEKVVTFIAAEHKEAMRSVTATHKEAMSAAMAEFADESRLCREERIEMAKVISADRAADREARHELAEKLNQIALNMRITNLQAQTQTPPAQPRPST